MLRKTPLNIPHIRCASVALFAAIVGLLGMSSTFAASADQRRLGKPVRSSHRSRRLLVQPSVFIRPATACPISSGESSWTKWTPLTATSVC
jgi:hypothetical protein